ncbi:MAG TPA: hypothetical protein VMR28_00865 [Candidatus Saccharimonadales bacterium]|nr:hypothetical protein [Candidatus Saccharimonadales bacterium]
MARKRVKTSTSANLKKQIAELTIQVEGLQKELDKKNSKASKQHRSPLFRWKTLIVGLCVAVAAVILLLGNIFFWAGNTMVNTNKYVATVGPLIEKPQIQSAIAEYTTVQIFKTTNVQQFVQQAIPPRAEFLVPQLTTQLQSYTQKSLTKILGSSAVHQYWYRSLARRHQALLKFSKSYTGNGTIDVSDIYSRLSMNLAQTKLSFLAGKQLPPKVGSIQVATVGWLPVAHKFVTNIGWYKAVVALAFVGFSALAIWLSKRRRRTVIQLSVLYAIVMGVTLIATSVAGHITASHFSSNYQSAIQVAYNTILASFVIQTFGLLVLSVLILLVAWISGPYKSAVFVQKNVTNLLGGHLHELIFRNKAIPFTNWVRNYASTLQWLSVALGFIVAFTVGLSLGSIIWSALLALFLVLVVEVLGGKQPKKRASM